MSPPGRLPLVGGIALPHCRTRAHLLEEEFVLGESVQCARGTRDLGFCLAADCIPSTWCAGYAGAAPLGLWVERHAAAGCGSRSRPRLFASHVMAVELFFLWIYLYFYFIILFF